MQNQPLPDTIREYVYEFFEADPQELISTPDKKIFLGPCVYISRKSLKYITHSRQHDA
jgi:hypothetical protein